MATCVVKNEKVSVFQNHKNSTYFVVRNAKGEVLHVGIPRYIRRVVRKYGLTL